jgi:hypothetical protein
MMSLFRSKYALVSLCLGLGVVACGPVGDEPGEQGRVETQDSILAELKVGSETVRFHEFTAADGSRMLAIQELAPATLKTTPIEELQRGGPLTQLEIFQALAPDRQAPQALADAHTAEALAIGRSDTQVRHVPFERSAPSEQSVAFCEGWVFRDPDLYSDWTNRLGRTNVSGYSYLNVGRWVDDQGYATVAKVTLGSCNESNATIQEYLIWDDTEDSASWFQSPTYDVGVGVASAWWNFTYTRYNCPAGKVCLHQVPMRYQVWGNSPSGKLYHLRTAELGPQLCTSNAQCAGGWSCVSGVCQPILW